MKDKTFLDEEFEENEELKKYMEYIKPFRTLKTDETIKLFYDYSAGSKEAYEKLIKHNLKLVIWAVKSFVKYIDRNTNIFELIDEGNIALMKAVKNYDVTKNTSFRTYALTAISNNIMRFINNYENIAKQDAIPFHQLEEIETTYFEKMDDKLLKDEIFDYLFKLDPETINTIMYYYGFYGKKYSITEIKKLNNISRNLAKKQINNGIQKIRKMYNE